MRHLTWGSALRALVIVAALYGATALFATEWIWEGETTSSELSGKAFQVMKLKKLLTNPWLQKNSNYLR